MKKIKKRSKRLRNIEDKNKVKNKVENKDVIEVTGFVNQPLSSRAKELINEIKTIQKNVDYRKLKVRGGNNADNDFSDYKTFKELFRDLYYKKTTTDCVERKQDEITGVMGALKAYAPRDNKYVEAKTKLVNNVKNFYKGREKILKGLKMEHFQFIMMSMRSLEKNMKKMKKMKRNNKNKINHLI